MSIYRAAYCIKNSAPSRAPAEGVSLPLDGDDEQRHTSPRAAGVCEGAEPPVFKVTISNEKRG